MTSLAFETADGYVLQIVAEWFQRSINHPVGRRHDRTCYANEKNGWFALFGE